MPTSASYYDLIAGQLAPLSEVSFRKMMGEYILYFAGKVVGGIYDDRLLLKPTAAAKEKLCGAPLVAPYPGAKEMILVENVDDRDYLCDLIRAVAADAPAKK